MDQILMLYYLHPFFWTSFHLLSSPTAGMWLWEAFYLEDACESTVAAVISLGKLQSIRILMAGEKYMSDAIVKYFFLVVTTFFKIVFYWRSMHPNIREKRWWNPRRNVCWRFVIFSGQDSRAEVPENPPWHRHVNENHSRTTNQRDFSTMKATRECEVDYYAAQRFWAKHQKYHTTNLCLICIAFGTWKLTTKNI